jgi:hypothetical protein
MAVTIRAQKKSPQEKNLSDSRKIKGDSTFEKSKDTPTQVLLL